MAKYYENQVFEGSSWNGYTSKNHLINALELDPVHVSQKVEQLLDVNLGENFVSMIRSHGVHYLDADKNIHRWYLETAVDENFELVQAYEDKQRTRVVGTTPGLKLGANRTSFYLEFNNKPFEATEIIVGMKPDLYRLWITDSPVNVGGTSWLYEVQLIASSETDSIPASEVEPNTRWSSDGGLTPDELSYTGFDISHKTNGMLESRLSQFRMKHQISGNMMKTKVKPMGFFIKSKANASPRLLWISNVEYEMYKKARWTEASLVMNGKSNVWADGTIGNIDKNGITATAGSGFKEQWASSNLHTWNVEPNLEVLRTIAMDAVVGKIAMSGRKMVIKAGEYGLAKLSDMVTKLYGASAYRPYNAAWVNDGTGRAFKWSENEIFVKTGQVMGIALLQGIEFTFVIDPSKDDRKRNKIMHPLGGPASSYEYDIMGFGGKDEKSNMQIVRRKGEAPIWGSEEGMRGWKDAGQTSFSNPKSIASAVDASTIHYLEPGIGAVVWDPTKIIRYYPELTQR